MHHHQCIIIVLLLLLTIAVDETFTCAYNGVCGGNPACQQPLYRPMMQQCQCQPSYDCGRYGCYRARARSASTRTRAGAITSLRTMSSSNSNNSNSIATQMMTRNPNALFMQCCIDRGLPDACLEKCTFSSFTRDALQAMYFKTDACPIEASAELQYCAAQGRDHSECCARNGVTTTLAGPKCLMFCDQREGQVTQLDLSYVACYDRFESMKACFWHDITRRHYSRSYVRT